MTATPPVSVVIVSRGRPESLTLALTGVAWQRYPAFEIVVVADAHGINAARALPFADQLKLVAFDGANISAARNLGIAQAAGEVVAFVDDDAVPEPLWLHHLICAMLETGSDAVGGFVRGRNGISFQWKARSVDHLGQTFPLDVDTACAPEVPPGHAVKTEGTNMAIRRKVLALLGGFDPGFRFYMDETDVNLRLAQAGYRTAVAPLAEVHHAYAESDRRRADRAVRDLSEVGASTAAFLRKHASVAEREARWAEVQGIQRRRLLQQVVEGLLEPRDVERVLETLRAGYDEGLTRPIEPLLPIPKGVNFRQFESLARAPSRHLGVRVWRRKAVLRQAAALAAQGHVVSVFIFTHTALFHSVRFRANGVWVQRGGLFGRSDRAQTLFRIKSLNTRLREEVARIAQQRDG